MKRLSIRSAGMTLTETLVAVTLSGVLVASAGTAFQFSVVRSRQAATQMALDVQANQILAEIQDDIEQALFCRMASPDGTSGTMLLCQMPVVSEDLNQDNRPDRFLPSSATSEGTLRFRPGTATWYGMTLDDGTPSSNGVHLNRWSTARDILPPSEFMNWMDTTFSRTVQGGETLPRWPSVQAIAFSVTPSERSVVVTLTISARIGDPRHRAQAGSSSNILRRHITRTFYWRNGL